MVAQKPEVVGAGDRDRIGSWYDVALGIACLNIVVEEERVDSGHLEPGEHNVFAKRGQAFELGLKGVIVP